MVKKGITPRTANLENREHINYEEHWSFDMEMLLKYFSVSSPGPVVIPGDINLIHPQVRDYHASCWSKVGDLLNISFKEFYYKTRWKQYKISKESWCLWIIEIHSNLALEPLGDIEEEGPEADGDDVVDESALVNAGVGGHPVVLDWLVDSAVPDVQCWWLFNQTFISK